MSNVRLRLVPDQPDDEDEYDVLQAGDLRAALQDVPDDAAIYVGGGVLWAMPRQDNRCIWLGEPGLPDDPRDCGRNARGG